MSGSVGLAEFYHPVVRFAEDILNIRKNSQQTLKHKSISNSCWGGP